MGWGWLVCHGAHIYSSKRDFSRHMHCEGPTKVRLQFSFYQGIWEAGPYSRGCYPGGPLLPPSWNRVFSEAAKQWAESAAASQAGRPISVNPAAQTRREDRSGGTEACQAGPLQKSIRPLQKLGAHGVLGFSENGQEQVGQGQGGGQEHLGWLLP